MKPDDWVVRDQIALRARRPGRLGRRGRGTEGIGPSVSPIGGRAQGARPRPRGRRPHRRRHRRIPRGRPTRTPLPVGLPLPGRALIEVGDYRAALEALARVDPGPPPADPKLSPSTLCVTSGAPDRAGAAAARRREGMRPPRRRGSGRGIRPDRLLPALLRGGGPTVDRRVRRLAGTGGRPDHGEPIPGRTSRGPGRCRERPTRECARRPLPGAMARAGRRLAGGRPRRVGRRPGVGDRPAASRGPQAARPVARSTRPWRDSAMSRPWPGSPSPSAGRSSTSGAGSMRCGRRPPPPPRKDTARAEIREGGCNVGGFFPNLV